MKYLAKGLIVLRRYQATTSFEFGTGEDCNLSRVKNWSGMGSIETGLVII